MKGNKVTIPALLAQEVGMGEFDLTLTFSGGDADAKTIMIATPNVYILVGETKVYFYEMNPVHMVPGHYRARLQTKLPQTQSRGTALSVYV